MKVSTRVIELNCLFLLVVALLVALQLFLQRAQQRLQLDEREAGLGEAGLAEESPVALPIHNPAHDVLNPGPPGSGQNAIEGNPEESLVAAPFVPNIRKSFPKRKAPYVRKGKNKKKAQKNKKKKQQKHGPHGGLKEEDKDSADLRDWGKSGGLKKLGASKGGGKAGVKFGGKHGALKAGGKPALNKHAKANGSMGRLKK